MGALQNYKRALESAKLVNEAEGRYLFNPENCPVCKKDSESQTEKDNILVDVDVAAEPDEPGPGARLALPALRKGAHAVKTRQEKKAPQNSERLARICELTSKMRRFRSAHEQERKNFDEALRSFFGNAVSKRKRKPYRVHDRAADLEAARELFRAAEKFRKRVRARRSSGEYAYSPSKCPLNIKSPEGSGHWLARVVTGRDRCPFCGTAI